MLLSVKFRIGGFVEYELDKLLCRKNPIFQSIFYS